MSVSIIITTFNGEKFLNSIISTIEPYYRENYEIIMIDDGSEREDNTLKLFSERFPKALCKKQSNSGVAAARNTGARMASKDYLQFIDIDDAISPSKLGKQLKKAKQENADVVYSDWRMVIYYDKNHIVENPIIISGEKTDYIESLLEKWWNPFHSYLIRKSSYLAIGGSNEKLVNAQDFDVMVRLAINNYKFSYDPGLHSFYYRYVNTRSLARGPRKKYWLDTIDVICKAIYLLKIENKLIYEYQRAAALRLFLVARNVYRIDKSWNKEIMRKIYTLDPNFKPLNQSIKFRLLYNTIGYNNTEMLLNTTLIKLLK
ncbi:glycosyltransferase family 2 protein [Arenibacter aquaticus]|nr:glycosyltransferase family 2 protein [Arenibacter aquaticus]